MDHPRPEEPHQRISLLTIADDDRHQRRLIRAQLARDAFQGRLRKGHVRDQHGAAPRRREFHRVLQSRRQERFVPVLHGGADGFVEVRIRRQHGDRGARRLCNRRMVVGRLHDHVLDLAGLVAGNARGPGCHLQHVLQLLRGAGPRQDFDAGLVEAGLIDRPAFLGVGEQDARGAR